MESFTTLINAGQVEDAKAALTNALTAAAMSAVDARRQDVCASMLELEPQENDQ